MRKSPRVLISNPTGRYSKNQPHYFDCIFTYYHNVAPKKTMYLYRRKLNFFLNQIAILIGLLQNPEKDGPLTKRAIRAWKMRHI
jgi:hypothetical protein